MAFKLLMCEMVKNVEQNEHYDNPFKRSGDYHQTYRVWDLLILEDDIVVKYRFTYDDTICEESGDRYTKRLQRMSFNKEGNGKAEIIRDFYYCFAYESSERYGEGTFDADPLTSILLAEGLLTWSELSMCEPFKNYVKKMIE